MWSHHSISSNYLFNLVNINKHNDWSSEFNHARLTVISGCLLSHLSLSLAFLSVNTCTSHVTSHSLNLHFYHAISSFTILMPRCTTTNLAITYPQTKDLHPLIARSAYICNHPSVIQAHIHLN